MLLCVVIPATVAAKQSSQNSVPQHSHGEQFWPSGFRQCAERPAGLLPTAFWLLGSGCGSCLPAEALLLPAGLSGLGFLVTWRLGFNTECAKPSSEGEARLPLTA